LLGPQGLLFRLFGAQGDPAFASCAKTAVGATTPVDSASTKAASLLDGFFIERVS